jgi:hypothetical protein
MVTNKKLHVKFSVQDPETERFITFEDNVDLVDLKCWFERAQLGVSHIFDVGQDRKLFFLSGSYSSKINTIKLIREFTFCGLKEAKDLVEGVYPDVPSGTLFVCEDGRREHDIIARFDEIGASVSCRSVSTGEFLTLKCPSVVIHK